VVRRVHNSSSSKKHNIRILYIIRIWEISETNNKDKAHSRWRQFASIRLTLYKIDKFLRITVQGIRLIALHTELMEILLSMHVTHTQVSGESKADGEDGEHEKAVTDIEIIQLAHTQHVLAYDTHTYIQANVNKQTKKSRVTKQ
jgi:hypothetical protein